ncbi:MAG: NAD-dependent epimerase/dehydratase family protein [Gaiellaceae bacterium]
MDANNDGQETEGMSWHGRRVLVTGGASFIGSHLVDGLVERGANVRVVDDLSSGLTENLAPHLIGSTPAVELIEGDLRRQDVAANAVRGQDVVFHLAAAHGGRGFVDLHAAACAQNLMLDGIVFDACSEEGVEKVVYASSACVYPNDLQTDPNEVVYLREEMAVPPYDADNMYGWAKLMGEKTLEAYYKDRDLASVSLRFFTVFGPRGAENHAILAMIARAFIGQDPFHVWGTGEQIRNWTYVSDVVRGTIRAAEEISDGSAVNIGTMERTRVIEAAEEVLRYTSTDARIETQPDMPTGPLNRAADNRHARELLGWEPEVSFRDGLHETIDWYYANKDRDLVSAEFERLLTER